MKPDIILFDLDGVLVQPGGYRAAVRATVNHFGGLLGLGEIAPDDETVAIFEAEGITCEWDMIPVILAFALDRALAQADAVPPLDSFQAACDWLRNRPVGDLTLDYAPAFRGLGRYTRPGEIPAETLLRLCEDGLGRELFPNLTGHGVLRELFSHTRRPSRSRTTHIFETFVLGDEAYSRAMRLPAEVRSESLLARCDRPLLLPHVRDRLLAWREQQKLHMAAYTARPSLPLMAVEDPLAVYAPEAEMALHLVGLESIPLMGTGQMGQTAVMLDENEDRLTKPAPYHALAAIVAAWSGDRGAALEWAAAAFRHYERGEPAERLADGATLLPAAFTLHIFEDSPAGMRGGKRAAELLRKLGRSVDLKLWGVSQHPEKVSALEQEGALVSADVNTALERALGPHWKA